MENIIRKFVKILFIIVVIVLLIFNIKNTIIVIGETYIHNYGLNLQVFLWSIIIVIFLVLIIKKINYQNNRHKTLMLLIVGSIFMFAMRVIIIESFTLLPESDQAQIFYHTRDLIDGNQASLQIGGYLNTNNNQLKLLYFFYPIIKIFGSNHYVFYYLNSVLITLSILFLSCFVRNIRNDKSSLITFILLNLFFPLNLMVALMYGEIFQLLLISLVLLVSSSIKNNYIRLISIGAMLALAYCARPSSVVLFIAFAIYYFVKENDYKTKIKFIAIQAFSFVVVLGLLNSVFSQIIQIKELKSLPFNTWIAQGLGTSHYGNVGMYNAKYHHNFEASQYNVSNAKEFANQSIKESLEQYSNINGIKYFVSQKIINGWCDPDFEMLNFYFPNDFGNPNIYNRFIYDNIIVGSAPKSVFAKNDFGQFVVDKAFAIRDYEKIFMMVILIFAILVSILKKSDYYDLLMELCLIGIFILQIIIEVKPRYLVIYTLLLIVYVAMNLDTCAQKLINWKVIGKN